MPVWRIQILAYSQSTSFWPFWNDSSTLQPFVTTFVCITLDRLPLIQILIYKIAHEIYAPIRPNLGR